MLLQAIQSNYDTYRQYWFEDMPWGIVTFDEHLNDLCKPGSWGTQVELQACSDCVNVNIYTSASTTLVVLFDEKKRQHQRIIFMLSRMYLLLPNAIKLNYLFMEIITMVLFPLKA